MKTFQKDNMKWECNINGYAIVILPTNNELEFNLRVNGNLKETVLLPKPCIFFDLDSKIQAIKSALVTHPYFKG